MKKAVVILAVVIFVIGLMLSSCGGSHTCPAYSQADTQNVAQEA